MDKQFSSVENVQTYHETRGSLINSHRTQTLNMINLMAALLTFQVASPGITQYSDTLRERNRRRDIAITTDSYLLSRIRNIINGGMAHALYQP